MEESWTTFHDHTVNKWQNQDWVSHTLAKALFAACSWVSFTISILIEIIFIQALKIINLGLCKTSYNFGLYHVCDYFPFLISNFMWLLKKIFKIEDIDHFNNVAIMLTRHDTIKNKTK